MNTSIRQATGKRTYRHRAAMLAVSALAAALLMGASPVDWGDWPNFRGPGYDGRSAATGFQKNWEDLPPVVFERSLGPSFSSFAAVGERLYTCANEGDQAVLLCLDATSGSEIWRNAFEPEFKDQFGDGTRATPTVNDGRVYVFGANGTVLCADAETGKDVWKLTFNDKPQWGYSSSVTVDGELAIFSPGKGNGGLLAVNKQSGDEVWKLTSDGPGYATPLPFTFDGTRYVAGFLAQTVAIAEAATGREVCTMPWKTDWDVNAATPIYHDGHLFIGSGYKTGCGVYKIRRDGDRLALDEVWRSTIMLNKFQTPVLFEGKLYGSDEKALHCVDFLTGKQEWKKPRLQNGTIIIADGHILLLTEKGELRIAPATPAGFEPVTKVDLLKGRCWSIPVLHAGRLYARNLDRMICVNLMGS